ncbi:MAG TPA: dTDP-glucose 4,6-dehydratase [Polyangia bacterium]|nr:dTDP-glucose 4,6-dehydratase [Polyangia bacterium]
MNVLVTGGSGFIGSNLVRHLLGQRPGWKVVNLDKLTYAANPESLADLAGDPRYRFVHGDIGNQELVSHVLGAHQIDLVIHSAAETHVDRSILGPEVFSRTNVGGTATLLEASRRQGVKRFLMVSTDEVYGSLGPTGQFTETTPLAPSSPYSASKAGADLLALAYAHTYKFDVVVTRCSNNYGPYQFPEKLIPLMIINALEDKPLPVYGDGKNVREWLHVADHCSAILAVAERGRSGEVYNVGSNAEKPNIEVVERILTQLGKPRSLIRYVEDRLGHDRRYAIDSSKLRRELDWKPTFEFDQGLAATVDWYLQNKRWWERVRSGAYREYYQAAYGARLQEKT